MTDDELAHLRDYVKWKPRHHAMILFLADTGCRVGGITGLKVQDIEFYEDRPGGRASVTEKGDKTRWVFFQAATSKALRTWLLRRHADSDSPYVFSPDGREIQAHSLSQSFRRLCLAAGIRSLGPHSLRHRKGFQIADGGESTAAGATLMGHDRVETLTRSYFPRDDESAEKLARKLAVSDVDEAKVIKLGDFRKAK